MQFALTPTFLHPSLILSFFFTCLSNKNLLTSCLEQFRWLQFQTTVQLFLKLFIRNIYKIILDAHVGFVFKTQITTFLIY